MTRPSTRSIERPCWCILTNRTKRNTRGDTSLKKEARSISRTTTLVGLRPRSLTLKFKSSTLKANTLRSKFHGEIRANGYLNVIVNCKLRDYSPAVHTTYHGLLAKVTSMISTMFFSTLRLRMLESFARNTVDHICLLTSSITVTKSTISSKECFKLLRQKNSELRSQPI